MYNGVWGFAPEAGGIFENFVLKVNLQSVGLLLTVSYEKIGEQGLLAAPQ